MSNNNEICIGCRTYDSYDETSRCKPIKDNKTCPCASCLIKMVCVDACEYFYEFFNTSLTAHAHITIPNKDQYKPVNS